MQTRKLYELIIYRFKTGKSSQLSWAKQADGSEWFRQKLDLLDILLISKRVGKAVHISKLKDFCVFQ
jgi:hypothetical protein